jgi:hypothetical protein
MRNRPGTQSEGKVSFEGEVSIAPDPSTNSLIINAARPDYLKIKEVIGLLDVKRRQVLVEATLVEVRLTNEEGLGVELQGAVGTDDAGYVTQTNFGGLTNLLTNPSQLSDLTIAAASTGTLTLPGGLVIPSQAVLISALSSNSNVNVLSSPNILATDNEEAEIIVGENVPFVTSTSTDASNINNTFNQIERQDVGITLRITPQISLGDYVLLKIFVEISNVVTGTRNDPNGPTTTIRTTETTVEVKDGQMIVTGGLISDNVTESERGVPFLQDIPVLGNLFKTEDRDIRRNNLLVFITPRIISDPFRARDHTKAKAQSLHEFAKENGEITDLSSVLDNRAIDHVAAELPSESIGAGTITPVGPHSPLDSKEALALERTQQRIDSLILQQGDSQDPAPKPEKKVPAAVEMSGSDDVIDITVSPNIPGTTSGKASSQSASTFGATAPLAAKTSYVVLRDLQEVDFEENYELPYADIIGTVGLIVKGEEPSNFFQTGKRYSYHGVDEQRSLVCLGTFANIDGATKISSGLEDADIWHELSPKELLNLGKGTWRER